MLHTAFTTTLIYFKWCAPYLNVHKENSYVIVIAYSDQLQQMYWSLSNTKYLYNSNEPQSSDSQVQISAIFTYKTKCWKEPNLESVNIHFSAQCKEKNSVCKYLLHAQF